KFVSANVLARLDGADDQLQNEAVIFCAHWDHFGKVVDDQDNVVGIYSGAVDNGSGVAAVLEIARAFKALPLMPKRSVIFLFTSLEESGLLGARYYVRNPAVPLSETLAVLNFDSMNLWGATRKFISMAQGHSSLDELLAGYAAWQGREIISD